MAGTVGQPALIQTQLCCAMHSENDRKGHDISRGLWWTAKGGACQGCARAAEEHGGWTFALISAEDLQTNKCAGCRGYIALNGRDNTFAVDPTLEPGTVFCSEPCWLAYCTATPSRTGKYDSAEQGHQSRGDRGRSWPPDT